MEFQFTRQSKFLSDDSLRRFGDSFFDRFRAISVADRGDLNIKLPEQS
ncbi:MAG: hypothetical protein P8L85_15055 [Rubripirellula sp.]|nr:hypothetical protein [Rubripirellula sp.]